MQSVKITKKGNAWFNTGHPWIYKSDIAVHSSASGCIVDVFTQTDKFLAKAFYNPKSQIALRVITRKEEDVNKAFWQSRIKAAVYYRKNVVNNANAYRIVFSESDGLPGLIVDKYADTVVIQINALGMDSLKVEIAEILKDTLNPKCIILRNDSSVRKLEGLKEEKEVIFGQKPDLIEVFEGDIKYLVDVWEGHKTGTYLDQRENRHYPLPIGERGRVRGLRALDVFCYQGLFSLHLAKTAKEVIALDSSQPALDMLKKNMELNSIKNITTINTNAFDKMKEFARSGEKFDIIALDPPAFAKSKKDIAGAMRGYKDLNLRAMQCLNEGGYLATFSCSHNFSEDDLLQTVKEAAADAKIQLRLLAKLIQSKDHPISITFSESYYLKGFVLQAWH